MGGSWQIIETLEPKVRACALSWHGVPCQGPMAARAPRLAYAHAETEGGVCGPASVLLGLLPTEKLGGWLRIE